jgi:hypothetical protein
MSRHIGFVNWRVLCLSLAFLQDTVVPTLDLVELMDFGSATRVTIETE